jgi:hypothetical protein
MSAAYDTPAIRLPVLNELLQRQPLLTTFSLLLLPLLGAALVGVAADPRLLDGESVWTKPAKFLASIALFAATAAWMYGYVQEDARRSRLARGAALTVVVGASLELAYISLQASRGEASHFNTGDVLHLVMYGLMGLFAVSMTAAVLPLAWLVARRPQPGTPPALQTGVVVGLVLTFVLGAGFGGYMSAQPGHAVGGLAGAPGLPLLGWSTTGGDLRPAHFLGIHAMQAIPLFGALAARRFSVPAGRRAVWFAAAAYLGLTVLVFAQALAAQPLLAL